MTLRLNAHTLFALLLVLSSVTLTGCFGCVLEEEAQTLAGSRAVDCGFVPIGESPVEAHACTANAFRSEWGFYARFGVVGDCADGVRAVVGDSDGRVWFLDYDPGWGTSPRARIGRRGCIEPFVKAMPDNINSSLGLPIGAEYMSCAKDGAPYDIICEE